MGRPKGSKNAKQEIEEMPKRISVEVEAEAKKPGPKTGGLLPVYEFESLAKIVGAGLKIGCPKCGKETKMTHSRQEQSGIRYRWHYCNEGCHFGFRTEQK